MIQAQSIAKRLIIIIVWTSILYVFYVITNRHQFFTPSFLPLSSIDQQMPFWTWTVVPYFMLIWFMYLPALIDDQRLFWRAMVALTIGVVINYTVFVLWPTVIERPPVPTGTAFYDDWYRWLLIVDTPANCFPSGHVTSPVVGCWAFGRAFPKHRWWLWLIFLPFTLTILTTKQHYVWDLLGGLATAGIGIWVTRRLGVHQREAPRC